MTIKPLFRWLIPAAAAVLIALLAVVVIILIPEKCPVLDRTSIEAGSELLTVDMFKAEAEAKLEPVTDLSAIDLSCTGEHTVEFISDGKSYKCLLSVVDTTAPAATAVDREIYNDQVLTASDFVTDIKDISEVTVSFSSEPVFTQLGTQTVAITLTDASGNKCELSAGLTVISDTVAPVFGKMSTISVRVGQAVSYKSGVTVSDNHDTGVTFTVDSSSVDLQKEGTYKVIYTATDSSGNTATAERTLTVLPKLVIDRELVDSMAKKVLDKIITDGMSEHQKLKAIYDWIDRNITYVSSGETDIANAAYVAFEKKRGDCYNFYAVTTVLLDNCGIQNMMIERYKGSSTHFWLLVNIGTGWYHFDTTPHHVNYPFACFMKTDEEVWSYAKSRGDGRSDYYNFDTSKYPARATQPYTY